MISFTSFPKPKHSFSYAPSKFLPEDENDIDEDEEDFDSGTKLTFPGEPVTSSHAYMRCVLLFLPLAPKQMLKLDPSVVVMELLSIKRP